MSGVKQSVSVTFDNAELRAALARVQGLALRPVWQDVGEYLVNATEERFRREQAPDGTRWAPVSPAHAKRKTNKLILTETTNLRMIHPAPSEEQLEVGTNRVYAAIHQFGLDDPQQPYVVGRGKGVGQLRFRHARMPARPFLGIGSDDETEILEIFRQHFADAWEGDGP